MEAEYKSGFVAIVGKPNAGKSTLMNRFVGEKVAIVSNKPQTTRNKILGVLTREGCQAVFIDTPGWHSPKTKLGRHMVKTAEGSAGDADVILLMATPTDRAEDNLALLSRLRVGKSPVFLVLNKIDAAAKGGLLPIIGKYGAAYKFAEIAPVSALTGENADDLLDTILRYLPAGPQYFPADAITDRPERFIVAEMLREKALRLLRDEIPHGVAVDITAMSERPKGAVVDIDATIFCEKDSHKGMIIGKGGAMLKEIGSLARTDIERILGGKVNLTLWVKVKKDWRESDFYIRSFGCWKE